MQARYSKFSLHSHNVRRGALALAVALVSCALAGCDRAPPDGAQPLRVPAEAGALAPHLDRTASGTAVLSWLEPDGPATALRFSQLVDARWRPARTVASGQNWFVNWADFPSVSPIRDDLWAAHWLVKRPGGTYAYDIAVALSDDGGEHWRPAIVPHADGTRTEHGFVSLFRWQNDVGAVWLDGRQMIADGAAAAGAGGGMTLRSARVGATGDVGQRRLVDGLVCDCCQTDVAIASDGPVAVYRNRTRDEVRDIYVARSVAGAWQPGTPVATDGWHIDGCPVNGPAIVARDLEVAVAWFTAARDRPRVRAALSRDGGATFAAPVDVDVNHPAGRVDIDWLDDEAFVVSWISADAADFGELSAQAFSATGPVGARRRVAAIRSSRASGFPQMIRQGDFLVFAWSDLVDNESAVHSARLPVGVFR